MYRKTPLEAWIAAKIGVQQERLTLIFLSNINCKKYARLCVG